MCKKYLQNAPDLISETPSGSMLMHALYINNFIQVSPQFKVLYESLTIVFKLCIKRTHKMEHWKVIVVCVQGHCSTVVDHTQP